MAVDESYLEAVDRFLADPDKLLDGLQPFWKHEKGRGEFQLAWPIRETRSGAIRSQMRFRVPENDRNYPSISLLLRGQRVCRVDRTRPHVCKPNPLYAQKLGLPHEVCGLHAHDWQDNRPHIAERATRDGHWEMPARRPVGDAS